MLNFAGFCFVLFCLVWFGFFTKSTPLFAKICSLAHKENMDGIHSRGGHTILCIWYVSDWCDEQLSSSKTYSERTPRWHIKQSNGNWNTSNVETKQENKHQFEYSPPLL